MWAIKVSRFDSISFRRDRCSRYRYYRPDCALGVEMWIMGRPWADSPQPKITSKMNNRKRVQRITKWGERGSLIMVAEVRQHGSPPEWIRVRHPSLGAVLVMVWTVLSNNLCQCRTWIRVGSHLVLLEIFRILPVLVCRMSWYSIRPEGVIALGSWRRLIKERTIGL